MRHRRYLSVIFILLILVFAGCETGITSGEAAELYYNLGNAYFELEEFDKAVTSYLNALELNSSLPQAGYNLARVYIESGKIEAGIAALDELLREDPQNSVILSTVGWAYYLLRDYEKSYQVYLSILDRTPTDANGLYNAAVLAWLQGLKEESLALYLRLYDVEPSAETQYRISSIYIDLEQWQPAIDTLEAYLVDKPEDADAYFDLGLAYTADRLYGNALEAFDKATEIEKKNPDFFFEKAVVLLLYIENVEEGLKNLQLAVEAGFDDAERAAALVQSEELRFADEVAAFFIEQHILEAENPVEDEIPGDELAEPNVEETPADGQVEPVKEVPTEDESASEPALQEEETTNPASSPEGNTKTRLPPLDQDTNVEAE